jgi:hypothetical protein
VTVISKTRTPANDKPAVRNAESRHSEWAEARAVFPIYLAIAKQLEMKAPVQGDKRALPDDPEPQIFEQVHTWLDQVDHQVQVHQLRHLLQMTTLNASEDGLRAMILRHLRKPSKSTTDRDKIDFLLVQYFALCAPAKIYHKQIELTDVAQVLRPVLGEVDSAPLDWCAPLEKMIETLRTFRTLREILKTNFILEGRRIKEAAGGMFYDPSALLAFIRFNFLLRRTLIELMHADLISIRTGLSQMEAAQIRTIDCRHMGLSAEEPVAKIRQIADDWKQPFQQNYTERSVSQAFEKLLALRSDVARAMDRTKGEAPAVPASASKLPAPVGNRGREETPAPRSMPAANPREAKAIPEAAVVDFETCLEKIWEQLIASPPTPGRSMTTIRVGSARVLMSSWEVTAFVSEDGPAAEDLRRAVVARALVTAAMESAKETGNATGLERALRVARVEVSRLQERVDIAKQAKDTEAAVNLGISTKRLISALDEAEKL